MRALTGVDTDRLPEERARGISITLGYAPLDLPDGRRLSLVDVPGHERFVRTMVAGATGIDLFLLVVDAAEGARPQTHEHLAVVRLLGVDHGVVAVTKADAVDAETLELAVEEARELVPEAEVVAVSARTGAGLDDLRAALARAADRGRREPVIGATRLPVDRVFTLPGVGTVATGTLWSGSIAPGDVLRAEPRGMDVRVRSVQVHDEDVARAEAGRRVAVALPGVDRRALRRGDMLVAPGAYPTSYRLDIALSELERVSDGARVSVHHATQQTVARVVRIGSRHAQLRLASPVVAARGDHVVLRTDTTVGGGVVLDPAPPRTRDDGRLAVLEDGDPRSIVAAAVDRPVRRSELAGRALLPPEQLQEGVAAVVEAGDWLLPPAWLEEVRASVAERLAARAEGEPLDPGLPLAALLPAQPWAPAVQPLLDVERRGAKAYAPGVTAALGARADAAEALERAVAAAGTSTVRVDDAQLAAFLESQGRLVRVGDGFAVSSELYEAARAAVVQECTRHGSITLARLRDLVGTGRRDAQLLLERLDADGLTRRVGDTRVLRRRGPAAARSS